MSLDWASHNQIQRERAVDPAADHECLFGGLSVVLHDHQQIYVAVVRGVPVRIGVEKVCSLGLELPRHVRHKAFDFRVVDHAGRMSVG